MRLACWSCVQERGILENGRKIDRPPNINILCWTVPARTMITRLHQKSSRMCSQTEFQTEIWGQCTAVQTGTKRSSPPDAALEDIRRSFWYSEVLLIFGGPTDIRRLYAYSLPDRRHRRRRCKTFLPGVNLYRLNTKMHISHLRAIFRYFVGVFPMLLDFRFYGIDLWMW